MTTLTEAAENLAEALRTKKYGYLIHMMNNTLEYYDIKTVGIYGHINDNGKYIFRAMATVGKDSPSDRHAEDLLLANINAEDIQNLHSFIILNRIPCEKCMRNIFIKRWNKLTLMIPSVLDSKSKWFTTQVAALDYMNLVMQTDEQAEPEARFNLVYIDD